MAEPDRKPRGLARALKILGIFFGSIFVLFVAIAIFSPGDGSGGSQPPAEDKLASEPAPATFERQATAQELVDAYGANEARANERFNGKAILVTGYVAEITEQEVFGGYTIQLEADQGWNNVMCATKDKDLALSLDTGQQVMLVGKGNGQVLGSPSLRDCRAFTQN